MSFINKFLNKIRSSETKKTLILFSSASILKTIGTMAAGILVIRWVEPIQIGLWQSLMIAVPYASIMQFGIMNGLNRELPFLMGAGKEKEGYELAAVAQCYAILLTGLSLFLTIIFLIIYWFASGTNYPIQFGILGVGIIIALTFYHNYLSVTFRAEKAFLQLSKVYFIQFFIVLISLLFVYYKNYYGLIAYYVFVQISLTFFMHNIRPVKIAPTLNLTDLKKLYKVGFPIFVMSYLQQISRSFTRVILLWTGSTIAVGLFAPATAIHSGLVMLPGVLAQYIYPRMSYIYGKSNEKKRLWSMVKKITVTFLLFSLIIVVPAWFGLPIIIQKYFPNYIEGIFAAKITLLTAAFTGSLISLNALYSIKAYAPMFKITIFKLIAFFIIPFALTKIYNPLEAVAIGNLIASFIVFVFSMWILYQELYLKKSILN